MLKEDLFDGVTSVNTIRRSFYYKFIIRTK